MTLVSYDTETSLITAEDKIPPLCCVSYAFSRERSGLFKHDDPDARDRVADWYEHYTLTGANIGFDSAVVMRRWPELTPLVFDAYERDRVVDTLVVQKLLDIAEGILHRAPRAVKGVNYSLQALVYRHLNVLLDKETYRNDYGDLISVPLEQWTEGARQYPVDDAVYNLLVHEIQQQFPDLLLDQFRQTRHAFWLHLCGAWGIRTDPVRVKRFQERLLDEQRDWITKLSDPRALPPEQAPLLRFEAGRWIRCTEAAGDRLRARLGAAMPLTAKGAPSLAAKVCKASGDPLLADYALFANKATTEPVRTRLAPRLGAAGLLRWEEPRWIRQEAAARALMARVMGPRARLTEPSAEFPGGQVALDYESCVDSGNDLLAGYGEYASVKKQLSSDIPALLLGELHCRFDSLKETGRSGCSEPYNLQNPPRDIGVRECFVPRPGYWYVDADYDGLESRAGAQACLELVGVSEMADVLNAGEDLHLHMAAALLGTDYATAIARYNGHKLWKKTHGAQGTRDDEISDARQFAKIANFGLGGGMGAEKFYYHAQKELKKAGARDLVVRIVWEGKESLWRTPGGVVASEEEALALCEEQGFDPEAIEAFSRSHVCTLETCRAQGNEICVTRVREVWRERWFEWPLYFRRNGRLVADAEEAGLRAQAEQLFSGRFRGGLGYADLNNTYFQALGADAAKAAGWRITRACYDWTQGSPLYGSRIVNFVHDQFLVEVPIALGPACAAEVGRIMVDEAAPWFPNVPATVTPCLATCWSKDAVACYDEKGELTAWSPE